MSAVMLSCACAGAMMRIASAHSSASVASLGDLDGNGVADGLLATLAERLCGKRDAVSNRPPPARGPAAPSTVDESACDGLPASLVVDGSSPLDNV